MYFLSSAYFLLHSSLFTPNEHELQEMRILNLLLNSHVTLATTLKASINSAVVRRLLSAVKVDLGAGEFMISAGIVVACEHL